MGFTMVPTSGFSGRESIFLMPSSPNLGPLYCLRNESGKKTSSNLTPFTDPSPNRFPAMTESICGTPPYLPEKSSTGNARVTMSPSIEVTLPAYLSNTSSFRVDIPVHVPVDCSAAMASAAFSIGRSVVTRYFATT